jgi:hypothetical protein
MKAKALPANKTKALLESFKRNASDLEVYETKPLSEQQRKELLNETQSWIVIGKSKWT